MVSGTFVLTDSIDKAFNSIFSSVYQGTDATITGKSAFDLADGSGTTAPPFDESLLPKVEGAPERRRRDRRRRRRRAADRQGREGDRLRRRAQPRLQRRSRPARSSTRLTLEEGAWPNADEVVIDVSTAGKKDLTVGQTIGVQAEGPVEQFRISGLRQVRLGRHRSAARRSPGSTCRPRRSCSRKDGKLDQIRVAAKPGVSQAQLVAEISAILPDGHAGADRRRAGGGGREGHGRVHLVPALLPARASA